MAAAPAIRAPALTGRFEAMCARIGRPGAGPARLSVPSLLAAIAAGGAVFGAVMGTYLVGGQGRWPLVIYAAVKVPALIMVST